MLFFIWWNLIKKKNNKNKHLHIQCAISFSPLFSIILFRRYFLCKIIDEQKHFWRPFHAHHLRNAKEIMPTCQQLRFCNFNCFQRHISCAHNSNSLCPLTNHYLFISHHYRTLPLPPALLVFTIIFSFFALLCFVLFQQCTKFFSLRLFYWIELIFHLNSFDFDSIERKEIKRRNANALQLISM